MKSQAEIALRLRRLRVKYAKRYIAKTQAREHKNCVYNKVHQPNGSYTKTKSTPMPMASRKQTTLLVIQPDSPVHICMYGAENPALWPGNDCDNDKIAQACKMFTPRVTLDDARAEFMKNLQNDEYVFDNYRDLAAFQWVLSDRLYKMHLSWWESIILWFFALLFRKEKALPESEITLPDNLWEDDAAPPPAS